MKNCGRHAEILDHGQEKGILQAILKRLLFINHLWLEALLYILVAYLQQTTVHLQMYNKEKFESDEDRS